MLGYTVSCIVALGCVVIGLASARTWIGFRRVKEKGEGGEKVGGGEEGKKKKRLTWGKWGLCGGGRGGRESEKERERTCER